MTGPAQLAIPFVQRWRRRRDSYRPAGEPIETRRYEVAAIDDDATARAFVERHHYSGSFPAARRRFGLYRGPALVGVAVFSVPTHANTIENVFPISWRDGAELGRFVLLDDVPANGETWFLARCFRDLRRDLTAVVSFSDPVPRTTADGRTVFPGHVGTIYQAHNGCFLGRGARGTLRLLPDGRVLANRAISKIRTRDRGYRYAAEQLERAGAPPSGSATTPGPGSASGFPASPGPSRTRATTNTPGPSTGPYSAPYRAPCPTQRRATTPARRLPRRGRPKHLSPTQYAPDADTVHTERRPHGHDEDPSPDLYPVPRRMRRRNLLPPWRHHRHCRRRAPARKLRQGNWALHDPLRELHLRRWERLVRSQ